MQALAVTLYIFKGFSSGTAAEVPVNPADKVYVSTSGKPLSEESKQKAIALKETVQAKGPFTQIMAAPTSTAIQTAILATGGSREDLEHLESEANEGRGKVAVNKEWRQVEMGKLAIEAKLIQEAYAKVHPEEKWIPEPNDCMNYPWPNQEQYGFEPYKTAMEPRIRAALAEICASAKTENEKVVVFTAKEPIRTVMLIAEPSLFFRESAFFKQMTEHTGRTDIDASLENYIERFNLDPKDGSWIKVRLENGRIFLDEVSKDVGFRTKAPVPGKNRG